MTRFRILLLVCFASFAGCGDNGPDSTPVGPEPGGSQVQNVDAKDSPLRVRAELAVTSSAFTNGEPIPGKYTEDGDDVSPPLRWSDVPEGVAAFALICDDPDAPTADPWVHWVIYGVPSGARELPEGVEQAGTLDAPKELVGARQGKNGWGTLGYRGPAPPPGGDHHYRFTVYALDEDLDLDPGLNKRSLLDAIEGHVVARGALIGTYRR